MGLQCRAITHIKKEVGQDPIARLLVLVEKKVNIRLAMWANHSNTLDGWRQVHGKAHVSKQMRLSRY